MADRELLEYAAKAASITIFWSDGYQNSPVLDSGEAWNPLTDDGDALRLAVKLRLPIDFQDGQDACTWCNDWFEVHGDPCAATRRVIVRAAAEIGKAMQ